MVGIWRAIVLIIGVIVILVVLAVLFIYSGFFNVAASYPDNRLVAWALSNTMDHSVRRHAKGIKVPNLNDPAKIRAGAENYRDDCVICHGAPGTRIGEVGRGLTPKPPELTKAAGDWKPNELFWITKHGIRMTGMPAWGAVDSDKELWNTVAFVRKLPTMSPSEYRAFGGKKKPAEETE